MTTIVPIVAVPNPTSVFFPVTTEASECGGPCWSPDGTHLAFHASLDLVGQAGVPGTEIFTIEFDTTAAQTGSVELNSKLRRLTFSESSEGDPISGVKNINPVYSADGGTIYFVSTRRAPTITLRDRSIWQVPYDGRLDPEIYFFSREDDVDPNFGPANPSEMVFSSTMGFPTEMLDRLEQEAAVRIREEYPDLSDSAVREAAAAERLELEYFARVMSHIYLFSGF
jgi:hypothetical protein